MSNLDGTCNKIEIAMLSPIDHLFARANLRCTKCAAPASQGCGCWEECSCGWSAEKGHPCHNPKTTRCSTKARFYGFRPISRGLRGWRPIQDAGEDGRLCALRFEDAEGKFESDGPFFLHENCWYLFEPPMQLDLQPIAFKPL